MAAAYAKWKLCANGAVLNSRGRFVGSAARRRYLAWYLRVSGDTYAKALSRARARARYRRKAAAKKRLQAATARRRRSELSTFAERDQIATELYLAALDTIPTPKRRPTRPDLLIRLELREMLGPLYSAADWRGDKGTVRAVFYQTVYIPDHYESYQGPYGHPLRNAPFLLQHYRWSVGAFDLLTDVRQDHKTVGTKSLYELKSMLEGHDGRNFEVVDFSIGGTTPRLSRKQTIELNRGLRVQHKLASDVKLGSLK